MAQIHQILKENKFQIARFLNPQYVLATTCKNLWSKYGNFNFFLSKYGNLGPFPTPPQYPLCKL